MTPFLRLGLTTALALASLAPGAEALAQSMNSSGRGGPPPPVHVLYLVRHGYYDTKDPADERVGKHLDALGREQAKLIAARLEALPVHFAEVRTSTFTRAMETGDILAAALGLPVVRDSLISECTPPSNRPDIRHDTPGEADSAQAQLEAAWAEYARPTPEHDTHTLLVCHGNVIRWFVTRALGVDTRQWGQMEIANASLTILSIRPDGTTRLVEYDDTGHLPLGQQTWAGRGPAWPTAKVPR